MKKTLLLALAGLLAAIAPALAFPPAAANVNFSSERGVPFGLVLDGRPLTRGGARQVHVDQLVPGLHWADFTLPTAYGGAIRFRSRVWLEPGVETSFVLIARPGWPLNLRQVNAVALYAPGYGRPNNYPYNNGGYGRYNSPAPYGPRGNAYPAAPTNGGSGYGNQEAPDSNYEDDQDGNGYNDNGGNTAATGNGYGNSNSTGNPTPGGAGYYPGLAVSSYRTMPPADVTALVQAVQQRPFEADKLSTAKNALAQQAIGADDLKRLLLTLDYETSRVELAKFGYAHVTDPDNFYRVYPAFNFEASKREVQQVVSRGRD